VVQRRRVGDEVSVSVRSRIPEGEQRLGQGSRRPAERDLRGAAGPCVPRIRGNAISRCLAGTGPTHGASTQGVGVYDLVGNAWEWVDMLIGTTDHTIDAEYPGAGLVLPTANGNIETLYAPTKDGNRSPAADAFSPATVGSARAEYDNDYYWQATGQRAAARGGIGAVARTLGCSACAWASPRPARTTASASASLLIWKSGDLHGTTARASENLAEIVRPGEGSDCR